MNPAQFIREGFVEIREQFGRTVLQTLGVILGVASVVATLGMTASMDARRDQYFRESGGTRLMGVYNQKSPCSLRSLRAFCFSTSTMGNEI